MEMQNTIALDINNLCKAYGHHIVLDNISLCAKQGDVIALLGQSGSGKSTLLRCINGLTTPDAGEIHVAKEHLQFPSPPKPFLKQIQRVRTQVSMVFQQFNLWSHLTVLQNIIEAPVHVLKHNKHEALEHAQALLKKVGMLDRQHHYPAQLSGGQQQRAAIARALAMGPQLLLFDEPTSALDPEMVNEVLNVMRQLATEGKTMLVATHEMSFARDVSTHVIFLDQGKLVEEGAPHAMFTQPKTERFRQFISSVFNRDE
jgi:ABC-type histidine transport system ATPase subunit